MVSGKFVMSCGYAMEMFDLAEEAFDQIAIFVDGGIKAAPCGGGTPRS